LFKTGIRISGLPSVYSDSYRPLHPVHRLRSDLYGITTAPAKFSLMEIQLLKLSVSDADLNQLASQTLVWPDVICNVHFAVVPEGVRVTGVYQQFIGISFQMLWQLSVSEGKVIGGIERVRAGFISVGFFKVYLLKLIAAATNIAIRDGMLVFDVDATLADKGWPVRLNLSSIRCTLGSLILESWAPDSVQELESQ
jgi:hypothetical protein